MKKIILTAKIIIFKKKFLSHLKNYYGNPQDVRDHLFLLSDSSRILSKFLKKDLINLNKLLDDERQESISIREDLVYEQGGCYDCPWGDGMGGCTIPGYCPDYE